MIKAVNINGEVLAYLSDASHIPLWLLAYKKEMQADVDACRKADNSVQLQDVSIKQTGDAFIFRGIFTETISFEHIEPWSPGG